MPNVFGREASSDRLRCILAFLEGLGDIDLRRVFTSLLVAEISSVAASAQGRMEDFGELRVARALGGFLC